MKYARIGSLLALSAIHVASLATECAEFQEGSTPWASCQSSKVFTATDNSLIATYQKVLAEFSRRNLSEERESLVKSQRAWLSFRDAECDLVHRLAGGAGSATLMDCKSDLTKERKQFLERLLK